MPRTVITGGAGFLGSHLCERFLAEGHEVVAVDNLATGARENIEHLLGNGRFQFLKQDVSEGLSIDGPVDYILHFASPASPEHYIKLSIETLKVGSYGTHNALELARAKKARFILASTSEVYGDPAIHPQPESYWGNVNPVGERSVYDEAKRYAEAATMAYHRVHKVETRIVRIFNTYGPRMNLHDLRVVPNFIKQALHGEPLTVYGDGTQTRSFCYVDDLVEGIFRLLMSDHALPVNLGTEFEMSILDFAKLILRLSGADCRIVHQDFKTQDDPKQRRPNLHKARSILGWEPRVQLEDGLSRTLAYFREKVNGSAVVR